MLCCWLYFRTIVALEFDKFWLETVMTALCLCFTCIWSVVTIFDTGLRLSEVIPNERIIELIQIIFFFSLIFINLTTSFKVLHAMEPVHPYFEV